MDPSARSTRVATIDVGTNSIRLMVAEARPDGTYRLLDDEKVVSRLGRGSSKSGSLDVEAMKDSSQAIARMKAIADGYSVNILRAVATCAVREADNRDDFLRLVRHESGVDLEVISAAEEARLAFLSVASAFDIRDESVAVADVGGGSTEVVLSTGGMVQRICPLPLGAVRITEMFAEEETTPEIRLKRMRRRIRRVVKDAIPKPEVPARVMIGTGGTFTALAYIDARRRHRRNERLQRPVSVRGYEVSLAEVRRRMEWLNSMSLTDRRAVPGLSPDRAEIIVAGLAIIEEVAKRLAVGVVRVHDRGIRDGLLLKMTLELFPETARSLGSPDRVRSVRMFAEQCHYEHKHCEHVTKLALEIFDQLGEMLPDSYTWFRDPAWREILMVAAVLHDVGYHINYTRHHRHSYHLIVHSELDGFNHHELELVANVARYHRKAHPKSSHDGFGKLPRSDQDAVLALSAVLRIADGLDRAHAGNVQAVRCEPKPGTMWFIVNARKEPEVDIWGAARKSRLFYKVTGLEPRFAWDRDDAVRSARQLARETSGGSPDPSGTNVSVGASGSRAEDEAPPR
jgi:exopolyphosphatase/guanosine-5'-triphosphate,3'-diphosphate pyrophosphatase